MHSFLEKKVTATGCGAITLILQAMEPTIFEIELEPEVKESFNFAPLEELFRVVPPKDYSRMLRDLHHFYSASLLAGFINQDADHGTALYDDSTPEDLFFIKVLADTFDSMDHA